MRNVLGKRNPKKVRNFSFGGGSYVQTVVLNLEVIDFWNRYYERRNRRKKQPYGTNKRILEKAA